MTDTPPPVREPTPTLDAFWLALAPAGRPRFYKIPDPNALGETDEALEMYQRKFDAIHGIAVPDALLGMVSKADAEKATQYADDYARWCEDYRGGFNVGDAPRKADPPIIPASVLAEPVKTPPPPPPPASRDPGSSIRPPVIPSAKKTPSLWSRLSSWFVNPLFK